MCLAKVRAPEKSVYTWRLPDFKSIANTLKAAKKRNPFVNQKEFKDFLETLRCIVLNNVSATSAHLSDLCLFSSRLSRSRNSVFQNTVKPT